MELWGGDILSVKKVRMSIPLQSASLSPGFGLSWQLRVVMEICSESGYGVIDGVGGQMECLRDGICPKSQDEDISSGLESESGKVVKNGVPLQSQDGDISLELELESGKVVGKGVPLHPPPLQGSDISALLTITFEKGWP